MGLLDPLNLIFLASLAVLVAIYLRARARPTLEVSSLMLFDEVAAPIASSRVLRTDALFWLEAAALAALGLALAGLYIKTAAPLARHTHRAMIFDLGAGMGALSGSGTRFDLARRDALAILDSARPGESFTLIGYALEADQRLPPTTKLDRVRAAVNDLAPTALPARAAALGAALVRARGATRIDLFVDRPPPSAALASLLAGATLAIHQVGAPADNLAIVSLEPGAVGAERGRCVVRNFSDGAALCDLEIDDDSRPLFHDTVIIEPHGQAVIPFGPLDHGGPVQARILTPDALAADNIRYAYAPPPKAEKALVLSPDPDVRDDLAHVLLAVNPNLIVTTADPSGFAPKASDLYRLAVFHDAYDPGVAAHARLIIFPQPWLERTAPPAHQFDFVGSLVQSEMQERTDGVPLAQPVHLGPTRVLALPSWMKIEARGADGATGAPFPLTAMGYDASGAVGVVAFDISDHLLLDPDRLEALVATVDLIKRLIAPQRLQVVETGASVGVPVSGPARIVAPDRSVTAATADQAGRVRFEPALAGEYRIESEAQTAEVYANYFDAAESDLSTDTAPSSGRRPLEITEPPSHSTGGGLEPLGLILTLLALLALVGESVLLGRKALRWGLRDA